MILQSPNKLSLSRIKRTIEPGFFLCPDETEAGEETYFDTFDFSLYQHDLILVNREELLILFSLKDGAEKARQPHVKSGKIRFWWELKQGELQNQVKPVIDLRALTPLGDLEEEKRSFIVQNALKKTVARGKIYSRTFVTTEKKKLPLPSLLTLSPLKGFDSALNTLLPLLEKECTYTSPEEIFYSLLVSSGYVSRLSRLRYPPAIESNWSICHTIKTVGDHLLDELQLQQEGIQKDVDTEFLHDYRVALRRFRAIVSQLKPFFLPHVYEDLKLSLKSLGKTTGELRDLDVLSLHEAYYASLVAQQLRLGLSKFFQFVQEKRRIAHGGLVSFFTSSEYSKTFSHVEDLIKRPMKTLCGDNSPPTVEVASATIQKRFKKLRKKISRFDHDKEIIHRIRIDCKKTRYLLELFAQLYSPKEGKKTIKELKQFQNTLGNLHDLHVQQEMLLNSIHEMEESEWKSPEATAAVGGLITVLAEMEQKASVKVGSTLEDYQTRIRPKRIEKQFG